MNPKCAPCKSGKCGGKYENRHMCNKGDCMCVCQITALEEVFETGLPMVAGAGLFAGGVAVSLTTGGLATPLIGCPMMGGGLVMAGESTINMINRERVDYGKLARHTVAGALVGGAVGGCIAVIPTCPIPVSETINFVGSTTGVVGAITALGAAAGAFKSD